MAREMGLEDQESFSDGNDAPPAYQEIAGDSNETVQVRSKIHTRAGADAENG